jgi:hypothetical protein
MVWFVFWMNPIPWMKFVIWMKTMTRMIFVLWVGSGYFVFRVGIMLEVGSYIS